MDLALENLACRRGDRVVFRGLAFHVAAGQVALVRGPNGVGKSSLLRVLAGLVPLLEGNARLGSYSLTKDQSGFQEQVAYAGHLDAIKPALTARQNIEIWSTIFGSGTYSTEEALAFFGLDRISERPAAQCSAGQKRRLGLARLMVMERPLWLLDEPTVSLDAEATGLVAELVRRHCDSGGLALIATHLSLGLDDAPVLEMSPIEETQGETAESAFLTGDWA